MCIYTQAYTHTRIHKHVHTHAHTYLKAHGHSRKCNSCIHMQVHMRANGYLFEHDGIPVNTHAHTNTHSPTNMPTHAFTHMFTCTHANTHKYAQILYTQTYTQACIQTHMPISACPWGIISYHGYRKLSEEKDNRWRLLTEVGGRPGSEEGQCGATGTQKGRYLSWEPGLRQHQGHVGGRGHPE